MCAPLPTAILSQARNNRGIYRPMPGLPGIPSAEGTTTSTSGSTVRFRDGSSYEFASFAQAQARGQHKHGVSSSTGSVLTFKHFL